MIGLIYIAAFIVYVLVSLGVVIYAITWAGKRDRSRVGWGLSALLGMYLLVFWDHIPTLMMHKYYCETEAGFWVYKTPEQWTKENPGVMETLVANKGTSLQYEPFNDGHGKKDTYLLNDRFNWIVIQQDVSNFLPIIRVEQEVKDVQKNEVLARYVDFGAGNSVKNTVGPPGPLKFWLHSGNCIGGAINKSKLLHFADDVDFTDLKGAKK